MRTAGRGPSRDLPGTDSRLDSRREEAGRGGEAQVERRVRGARGGCQSGRDETWRRITSDNDGNAKMQCTSSSTAALGRDGGRRQIMRCYRARASAVRRSGGAKDGVVARLLFRTLSSVPDSQFVVSVVVGLEVAGGVMPEGGRKRGVIRQIRFPASRALPGHRTDFFWPLHLLPLGPCRCRRPLASRPLPSLSPGRKGWPLLSPVLPVRCRGELESGNQETRAPSDDVVPFCAEMAFFESQMGIPITLPPGPKLTCARHPRRRVP